MFTYGETFAACEKVAREHPDASNPTEQIAGSYDDLYGWVYGCFYNKDGRHCFAGQVIAEMLGEESALELEEDMAISHQDLVQSHYDTGAKELLDMVQSRADAGSSEPGIGQSWSLAWAEVLDRLARR